MTEVDSTTSPSSTDGLPEAAIEQGYRIQALELAAQLHAARLRAGSGSMLGAAFTTGEVIDTARRFADYLRDGK